MVTETVDKNRCAMLRLSMSMGLVIGILLIVFGSMFFYFHDFPYIKRFARYRKIKRLRAYRDLNSLKDS